MHGLYAIVDADFLGARAVPLLPFAEAVLAARPVVLQLRAKHATPRETLDWLRELRGPCTRAGALLFANDRPDLAVLAGCDGVHVGQDDLEVRDVRRFAPTLRVGVSTHDDGQLRAALALRPDYVALGPIFPTSSKARPDPVVGLDALRAAGRVAREANVPLVGIGGIDVSNAHSVAPYVEMVAVISALLPEEGIAAVSRRASTLAELARLASSSGG